MYFIKFAGFASLLVMTAFAAAATAPHNEKPVPTTPGALQEKLAQISQDAAKRSAALKDGQRSAAFCRHCHGAGGNSVLPEVPNLASQNAVYLLEQMNKFAQGQRKSAFMEGLIRALTPDERVNIALFLSQQPVTRKPATGTAQAAEGKALYLKLCVNCHGANATGTNKIPRLAGQQTLYLQSSLKRYRSGSGERIDPKMSAFTRNLKDADIKDTLQRFSELTQLNIVLDPDVRGTVTVSLQDIPWDQALELILKINQLGYVLEGNIMRIASTSKLTQEENARLQFITAQDKNRPLRTVLQKVSYANAGEMAATARKVMSARGDIFIDTRSNTLVIKELPDYLPTVLDLIKNLDIASPQVMIEARIVEANRTFSNEVGIVWGFGGVADSSHGNTTGLVFPNSGTIDGNVSLPSGAPQVLQLTLANVLDTFRLDAALHAAESRGLVKVVSTPKVQTQTGEQASIQSGFQIPVQTTVNNTTSVLYINATLRLDVTPQITNEGTVIMDVSIQKREPAVGINIAGGQNIPLTTRDAKTRLMVRDGGTAVIGGIFKITSNDGQSMIPGLWKIPILGNLFRSRTQTESTDELMIFITPRIIR